MRLKHIIFIGIMALLTGCVTLPFSKQQEGPAAKASAPEEAVVESVVETVPDIVPEPAQEPNSTRKVSLTFYNEPLIKVLPVIGNNIELDPSVEAGTPVSLNVEEMSIEKALTSLLKPAGLTFKRKTGGFLVVRQPLITFSAYNQPLNIILDSMMNGYYTVRDGAEMYLNKPATAVFNNLPLEIALDRLLTPSLLFWKKEGNSYVIFRDREALFYVDFPIVEQSFEITSSRSGSSVAGIQSTTSSAGLSATGSSFSRGGISAALSTASARGSTSSAANLVNSVKQLLTETGKIAVHREMGAIWIRDRVDVVDRVGSYLEKINKRLRKTVRINGIITEVTLDNEFAAGINWDMVIDNVAASAQSMELVSSAIGLMTLNVAWNDNVVKAFILALDNYGDVRVVSKPSLSVVNGAIGSLIVGTTISYVAQSYVSTTSNQSSTSSLIVEPLQTGLSFYVLPRIINDEEAVLYISPELTTLKEIRTITSGDTKVEAPSVEMKQTQTVVTVKNGETLILSGIMSESERTEVSGIPLLMDLPIIGAAFRYEKEEKKTSEFALMIEVKW